MDGRDKLGYFYLDDTYCSNHDMHPETLTVFYDKNEKKYVYIVQLDCKEKEGYTFTDKKELLVLLKHKKDFFVNNYPEVRESYGKMIHKVKKYKPASR